MWNRLFSDEPYSATRAWFWLSLFWLIFAFTGAGILATKFVVPGFLGELPYLQFGRIRPMHVNSAGLGFISMATVGAMFYIVPRLCGTKLYSERLGVFTAWAWFLMVLSGVFALAMGYSEGREYAEFPAPVDLMALVGLILVGYNMYRTIAQRREKQLYISLWYFMGTFIWFPMVYLIGNRTFVSLSGLNDAAVNWFFGHNVLGLWFTTLGVGVAYYLLPIITRQPLFSHKLSLIGFWTIAMVYAPTGAHHLLQAPIPEWLKSAAVISSLLLLIPVFAAVTNFFMTVRGQWGMMGSNLALRFTMIGIINYLLTCLQGPLQAARPINYYVHFTNWVVGHAHIALLGSFAFIAFGAMYHMIPVITKRPWHSRALGEWHFWLTFLGFWLFFIALTILGLQQAQGVMQHLGWIQIIYGMQPMLWVRWLSWFPLMLGQVLFVYNIIRTIYSPAPATAEVAAPTAAQAART
jgi:cytochrome c oxidase cbb3-type subunit I